MREQQSIREAREARRLTIAQAARDLSIPETTLLAFETGDVSQLPPQCFATGFLRSYCRYLGLHAEPHLQALHQLFEASDVREKNRASRFLKQIGKRFPTVQMPLPPEIVSWGVITTLVLSGWIGYSLLVRPDAEPSETQASAAAIELRLPDAPEND